MQPIPKETLQAIERRFHALIQELAGHMIEERHLPLPRLEELLASGKSKGRFPITGWGVRFGYWFEGEGDSAKLIVESFSRFVAGSGQRHEITADEVRLVEEGFV